MSNSNAIAAVTDKLVSIAKELGATATAMSPDVARAGEEGDQLNVCLYNTSIEPTWRNQDLPHGNSGGQPRRPLLPLRLHYLVTAYGTKSVEDGKPDVRAQSLLGRLMLRLHDKPEFRESEFPAGSGIKNTVDPIRITYQPMTLDEMSKLWSSFQTAYRTSVAFEVGVLLIESDVAETTPLPVTQRGPTNTGWDSSSVFPARIDSIGFATDFQPGAQFGEDITIRGENLVQPGTVSVTLQHVSDSEELDLTPKSLFDEKIEVTLPNAVSGLRAGVFLVRVTNMQESRDEPFRSAPYPIALLPKIIPPTGGLEVKDTLGVKTLSIDCKPPIRTGQKVQLLIGSRPVPIDASALGDSTSTLTANLGEMKFEKGDHAARLVIDGVQSSLVDPDNPEVGIDPRLHVRRLPR